MKKFPQQMLSLALTTFKRGTVGLLLLSLLLPASASAGILDGIFGLDESTRRDLRRLPNDVQEAMVKAFLQVEPLINEDINEYLTRLNEIIDSQINHVQCSTTGLAENIIDVIIRKTGHQPRKFTTLRDQLKDIRRSNGLSEPTIYADRYSDFLSDVAATYCSAGNDKYLTERAAQIQAEARKYLTLWKRLEKMSCKNPKDCFFQVQSATALKLKASTEKDKVGGLPSAPADGALQGLAERFGVGKETFFEGTRFEDALLKCFDLQDSIDALASARKAENRYPKCLVGSKVMAWDGRGNQLLTTHKLLKRQSTLDKQYTIPEKDATVCPNVGVTTLPDANNAAFVVYVIPPDAKYFKATIGVYDGGCIRSVSNYVSVEEEAIDTSKAASLDPKEWLGLKWKGIGENAQTSTAAASVQFEIPQGKKYLRLLSNPGTHDGCWDTTWWNARFDKN